MSFLKAKKFLMSRATDTKIGRAQLLKQVGDDVTSLLDALEVVVGAYADKATAESTSKYTLKLAAKIGLLVRENVIPPEAAAPLTPSLLASGEQLLGALQSKPGTVDVASTSASILASSASIVDVIKPFMKEKNWRRVEELGTFYASAAFLSFLCNDPSSHLQRDILSSLLLRLTTASNGPIRSLPCVVNGCELPRLHIRGAEYCQGHQAVTYACGPPDDLETFSHNIEHASIFQEYLCESHPQLLPFAEVMTALKDFAQCTSRNLLKSRAPLLLDRFFRSPESAGIRYLPVPPPTLAPIVEAVDDGRVSARVFEPIHSWCYEQLNSVYRGPFKESRQYAEWAAENLGFEIPPVSAGRAMLLESMGVRVADVVAVPGRSVSSPSSSSSPSSILPSAAGAGSR